MPKKMKRKGQPEVHEELSGFDIKINPFGELESNFAVDRLNHFLNKTVDDKKLRAEDLNTAEEE